MQGMWFGGNHFQKAGVSMVRSIFVTNGQRFSGTGSCADYEGTVVVRPNDYFNCSMLTFQIRMLISYWEPA